MEKRGRKTLTTSTGMPIDNNQFSQTAGAKGPILIQDFALIDKLAKFDRYEFIYNYVIGPIDML